MAADPRYAGYRSSAVGGGNMAASERARRSRETAAREAERRRAEQIRRLLATPQGQRFLAREEAGRGKALGRQQQLNRLVEEIIGGRVPAAEAARRLQAMQLTADETRWLRDRSRRRSAVTQRQRLGQLGGDLLDVAKTAAVAPLFLTTGHTSYREAGETVRENVGRVGGSERRMAEARLARLSGQGLTGDDLREAIRAEASTSIGIVPGFGRLGAGRAAMRAGEYVPRTMTLGAHAQQFPKSRSRLTAPLVATVDRASEALTRMLPEGEGRLARATRATVGKASSRGRVPKQAGRMRRIEAGRAQAGMADEINTLRPSPLGRVRGGASEAAHWWWAQLPVSHRNAEGLRLVRGKQAEELAYRTSGKALKDLKARERALRAELATADPERRFRVLAELEDAKVLLADLPAQVEDLAESIAKLDQLIARPPVYNPRKVEALAALSGDRKRVLVESGVLDPDRAAEREGLVSRWVGLEPTGEELYLGHRLQKVRGSRPSLMPGGVATGRGRVPEGAASLNRLVLAKTGRVRQSFESAIEDWQAAQVFESGNAAKRELAAMGQPLQGTRIPAGHIVVNPKGRPIPRAWSRDAAAQATEEGFDVETLVQAAREHTTGYLAETQDELAAMMREAAESGVQWEELRVVPRDVAERYFAQFLPAKTGTRAGRVYDSAVNAAYMSIIYARLGYVPKNIAQNLIIAVPHQGAYLPVNLARVAQVFADPKLRTLIRAEVSGSSATRAAAGTSRGPIKSTSAGLAGALSYVADDPLRASAFLHEAAAAGVISRANPLLTRRDRRALLDLLTDKGRRPLLNDVRARAVEAMADFDRMTPTQRLWARRFAFIPGWLVAGTRYPFAFAANHPVRSALMAYVAAGEPGAPEELQLNRPITDYFAKGMPSWLEGVPVAGKLLRTRSLSPVSTPWEIGSAVAQQGPEAIGGFANPVGESLYNVSRRRVDTGTMAYQTSFGESVTRNLEGLAPNIGLARDLLEPSGEGLYPGDATRGGRLAREVGVLPIEVDPAEAAKLRAREEGLPAAETAYRRDLNDAARFARQYIPGGKIPRPVVDDLLWRRSLDLTIRRFERDHDRRTTVVDRAVIAAELFGARYPQARGVVDAELTGLKTLTGPVQLEAATRLYERLRADGTAQWRSYSHDVRAVGAAG